MTTRRNDRPLTARSVLASALLGSDPPALTPARLVAVAALFGISENATRVALSRMVTAGELAVADGRYRLVGPLLDRHGRQRQSRRLPAPDWDGTWTQVVVTSARASAADRTAARAALHRARLGELREGVWLRPANLAVALPRPLAATTARFAVTPEGDGRALAASLWDLDGWAAGARDLLARLAAGRPEGAAALAPGFVLSAAVLRHLQADPLLPRELLPRGWPGERLRARYDAWDAQYRSLLRAYHLGALTPSARA
jgi:phenylacetic acid degradation operon negative regulatory protein